MGSMSKFTIPQSLIFTRKSGKSYYRWRTDAGIHWKESAAIDHVRSLETGETKAMSREEFEKFRSS